MASEYC
ncbi:unnamed protein product [Clonostachys chloroleuca]|nr:unnamed protein product [Clonostachys chloroleuca]